MIWTTPAGQRYTTVPGSRLFFPRWNVTTAALPPMAQPPPDPGRTAKMPRRRRTRAAENAARIKAEREANAVERALRDRRIAANSEKFEPDVGSTESPPRDYGSDPPPF